MLDFLSWTRHQFVNSSKLRDLPTQYLYLKCSERWLLYMSQISKGRGRRHSCKQFTKGPFIFYEVGGVGGIFRIPITNYHAPPPPHSVLIFSHASPPPFKRDIIVIKPDKHIFCSVKYDLYFLFNVKLLTTHSTDIAATSVNSKNKFCPFAKALLHYF